MEKLGHIFSGNSGFNDQKPKKRKHVPWMSGPLDPKHHKNKEEIHALRLRTSNKDADPVFKRHHEASPIELFYDLFFVANLATFTMNHEIFDAESLKSYIGFFSLIWFTWFQISLFDVRFASDSVAHRVSKAFQFGGMAGFALVGSAYDTTDVITNQTSFQGIAIILMINRLALCFQYGMVLFYVKNYPRTHAPLFIIMGMMFISSMAYLATFFGFYGDAKTYIVWYVFGALEVTVVIATSSHWRVLSFTKTHLVERIGLLTLIIMGEGVLGLVRSAAWILKNTQYVSMRDAGVLIAAVLLIYFIWILYFDQIEHERFGTVRQQLWAIMHYPVHLFILFTVEGQTNLLLWNLVGPITYRWLNMYRNTSDPELQSSPAVLEYLNGTLEGFLKQFKSESIIKDNYNYTEDLVTISEISYPAGSVEWNNEANFTIGKFWLGVTSAIFESFEIAAPEFPEGTTERDQLAGFTGTFDIVFTYFYIASGLFLISLGVLYAFGKGRLHPGEWASVAMRVVAGIGLSLAIVPLYYPVSETVNNHFIWGPWHIPIVMLVFFIVIVLDNLLIWRTNKSITTVPQTDLEDGSMSNTTLKAPDTHAHSVNPISQQRT